MKFKIFPRIFTKYPGLNIGVVSAKGIDNTGSDRKIFHLLQEIEQLIRDNYVPSHISKHALISPWRAAYNEFGAKPSHYPSSVEALMKRIFKDGISCRVNKAVDIYNYLALKHMVPIGAYDSDKLYGIVSLTHANGTERFVPIGAVDSEHPAKGEVVYKDSRQVLCRRWNWRDSNSTKIKQDTKNIVIFVEGIPPVNPETVEEICKELTEMIKLFCGGEISYKIAGLAEPEADF